MTRFFILFTLLTAVLLSAHAQTGKNEVYIDQQGRMRWQKDHSEVYLFGVNYTVPFAYGYRSLKALNKDIEKEIDEDVYHLSRMGADAFRVHIWDTEISDTAGNLLENDHLKLFDYLLYRLKQRNIHIIITPIAFWGNGYPQRDEKTAGFSSKYNKGQATINENAIKAQENYIRQLLQHVNPYTKLNYRDDPDIIAAELNNEPSHSGPMEKVTAYINRLAAAARGIGWTKPLFYNISQSPYYADAVAKSTVNGFSFQWYPSGLVAGHEQKGNFLPYVDRYAIPFDTIPEFHNKARMVYEFETADVLQPNLYPAVARSFKMAGFQWVTQFAYDPLATAYANTEYQTHYLNLAYTPAKAISFLIANRVFHLLPRDKNYGTYPADSVFDAYHLSYNQSLSEMNTSKEFYYTGNTSTAPADQTKLLHVAGTGTSPVISYKGYGAYFLDKLENGIWRLEVMPDAITIRDPFEKASPSKEVVHIAWADEPMQVNLTELGNDFSIKGINAGNEYQTKASGGSFTIKPGTYLLVKNGKNAAQWTPEKKVGNIGLDEFVAPQSQNNQPYVNYTPPAEIDGSWNKDFTVAIKAINIPNDAKVTLVAARPFGAPVSVDMTRNTPYDYSAIIPAAQLGSSILNYRVIIKTGDKTIAFPGGREGDPYAWDNTNNDFWQTFVATEYGKVTLFNASTDRPRTNTYFPFDRQSSISFASGETTGQLALRASCLKVHGQSLGFQLYIADKLKYRMQPAVAHYTKVSIRARSVFTGQNGKIILAFVDDEGAAYSAVVELSHDFKDIEVPLSTFKPDSAMLLPRPYPGFQPLWFKPSAYRELSISRIDKLQVTMTVDSVPPANVPSAGFEVENVTLEYQ